jgi:hypothetical protein
MSGYFCLNCANTRETKELVVVATEISKCPESGFKVWREQGSGTRITIERVLGMKFNSEIEINSNEAIIEAVQAGLGIGFVSKHTVKLELENSIIKQLNIDKFPITRHWHTVHSNKTELSPIAQRLVGDCRELSTLISSEIGKLKKQHNKLLRTRELHKH